MAEAFTFIQDYDEAQNIMLLLLKNLLFKNICNKKFCVFTGSKNVFLDFFIALEISTQLATLFDLLFFIR